MAGELSNLLFTHSNSKSFKICSKAFGSLAMSQRQGKGKAAPFINIRTSASQSSTSTRAQHGHLPIPHPVTSTEWSLSRVSARLESLTEAIIRQTEVKRQSDLRTELIMARVARHLAQISRKLGPDVVAPTDVNP